MDPSSLISFLSAAFVSLPLLTHLVNCSGSPRGQSKKPNVAPVQEIARFLRENCEEPGMHGSRKRWMTLSAVGTLVTVGAADKPIILADSAVGETGEP